MAPKKPAPLKPKAKPSSHGAPASAKPPVGSGAAAARKEGDKKRRALTSVGALEARAVNVSFLRAFTDTHDLWSATTATVVHEMIVPATAEARCSFTSLSQGAAGGDGGVGGGALPAVTARPSSGGGRAAAAADLAAAAVGPATHFVSHSWANSWGNCVRALEGFAAAAAEGGAPLFFWLDIFAVTQHAGPLQDAELRFDAVIACTRRTVLVLDPWDAPRPLTRVWCLFELMTTILAASSSSASAVSSTPPPPPTSPPPPAEPPPAAADAVGIALALPPSERARFIEALREQRFGRGWVALVGSVAVTRRCEETIS